MQSRPESQSSSTLPSAELFAEFGFTREVLHQASEVTWEQMIDELTAHLMVYFMISGFVFMDGVQQFVLLSDYNSSLCWLSLWAAVSACVAVLSIWCIQDPVVTETC